MPQTWFCIHCRVAAAARPPSGNCPLCGGPLSAEPVTVTTPAGEVPTVAQSAAGEATQSVTSAAAVGLPFPKLSRYVINRVIRAGGMGVVYEAVQTGTGRICAVKIIFAHGAVAAWQRDRFDIEARSMAGLDHPNVVRLFDAGEEGGMPYLAMEYVPGGTLGDRLLLGTPTPAEAARILADAADGVAAAHAVKILHRDVKPSNILLTAAGVAKIGDFGLAKLLNDSADGPTRSGQIVGTPQYMAPEQAEGRTADLCTRTDVFNLGATLFHALTGKAPFTVLGAAAAARRAAWDGVPSARGENSAVPPDLDAVVRVATARDPADRYESAAAFAADLRRFLANRPTLARPLGVVDRSARVLRRYRWPATVAVMLPLLAGAAAVAVRESTPQRQIERKLARGEAVTLVGERGQPTWHEWRLGPATLGESVLGDGTLGFQTHTDTFLELVPDPQTDSYEFGADIRHVRAGSDGSLVGIYVASGDRTDDTVYRCARYLTFAFQDHAQQRDIDPNVRSAHGLSGFDVPVVWGNGTVRHPLTGVGIFRRPAAGRPDGIWRRVVVRVTPVGVMALWQEPDGTLAEAMHITPAAFRRHEEVQAGTLAAPGQPVPLAAWRPRGPVGLFALDATVAYRNVTISPIRP